MTKPTSCSLALPQNNGTSGSELAKTPGLPVAVLRHIGVSSSEPSPREVSITVPGAPLGSRVYLESQPISGPPERVRAFEMPDADEPGKREFRTWLPPHLAKNEVYIPVAVYGAREVRGPEFRVDGTILTRPTNSATPTDPMRPAPSFATEHLAHVEAELPTFTVFGPTADGFRVTFYISEGNWNGPRIHARYKPEGGDWIIVRPDGVAIPNARATLETTDGALLYYELTGTMDLGHDGYARALASDWPSVAGLALVARISTSAGAWKWLNRLTLVATGTVDLKAGHTSYDLFSISC